MPASLERQGREIVGRLIDAGIEAEWDMEIVALIAYLQRLGQEGKAELARRADEGGSVLAAGDAGEGVTVADRGAASPGVGGGSGGAGGGAR